MLKVNLGMGHFTHTTNVLKRKLHEQVLQKGSFLFSGSVSDISAFQYTDFYRALEDNEADLPPNARLPRTDIISPYCFVGDEIFTLKPYMMRPFARHNGLDERQKNFNYRCTNISMNYGKG